MRVKCMHGLRPVHTRELAPETRSRNTLPGKYPKQYKRRARRGSLMMKQPDWGMGTVLDEKNKPIWLANWRHVMSRQANFSTHEGACSWNRFVQQICPWSLLPHIKPVWYEGAKLGSKSFVEQHIFSLEIVGADEGALLRERVAGACCGMQAPSCVPTFNYFRSRECTKSLLKIMNHWCKNQEIKNTLRLEW